MVSLSVLLAVLTLSGVYALSAGARESGILARLLEHRRTISAAAGVSVAYVFVDLLPELAAQNEALRQPGNEVFFDRQRIYLLALFSFVVLYGIDHIVLSRREQRREKVARSERDAIYRLHLAGFSAYSALIGYLLVERVERGLVPLVVYTLAMAVHFVIVSHSLAEEHGSLYRRRGHWVLSGSVLAGWAIGSLAHVSEATVARLFALLAGGVVITSLRSELPDDRYGRFWPFCLGSAAFAGVLLAA
jgi:hypothetical protein